MVSDNDSMEDNENVEKKENDELNGTRRSVWKSFFIRKLQQIREKIFRSSKKAIDSQQQEHYEYDLPCPLYLEREDQRLNNNGSTNPNFLHYLRRKHFWLSAAQPSLSNIEVKEEEENERESLQSNEERNRRMSRFRNSFWNLQSALITMTQPVETQPPATLRASPTENNNIWEEIHVTSHQDWRNVTCYQLLDFCRRELSCHVTNILLADNAERILYAEELTDPGSLEYLSLYEMVYGPEEMLKVEKLRKIEKVNNNSQLEEEDEEISDTDDVDEEEEEDEEESDVEEDEGEGRRDNSDDLENVKQQIVKNSQRTLRLEIAGRWIKGENNDEEEEEAEDQEIKWPTIILTFTHP
jgi:hypothetical protein